MRQREVLIVDDDPLIRKLLGEIIFSFVFNNDDTAALLNYAPESKTALSRCFKRPPDLIITDLNMGFIDEGLLLAKLVKERFPAMPIILVSSESDLIEENYRRFFSAIFKKPVDIKAFTEEVRKLLFF